MVVMWEEKGKIIIERLWIYIFNKERFCMYYLLGFVYNII